MMPNETGRFSLCSDTSKEAAGGVLYQEQKGQNRLVAYCSKKLPDAASRYSISELELCGMMANIAMFKHLLRYTEFTVYVDHSALVHIIKAKREPPTLRLKKLIETLSEYSFILKYLKGKDMWIADFLSRHADNDPDSPNEIIPIAFCLQELVRINLKDNDMFMANLLSENSDSFDNANGFEDGFLMSFTLDELFNDDNIYEQLRIMLKTDDHCCELCDIYDESDYMPWESEPQADQEALLVFTRGQTAKEELVVPPVYPLHGVHKKPEHAKTPVIDPNVIKPPEPKVDIPKPNPIPILPQPLLQKQAEKLPKEEEKVNPKMPMEPQYTRQDRIAPTTEYEGLINPKHIDLRLLGLYPEYDSDKIIEEINIIPTDIDKLRTPKVLFPKDTDINLLRKHLPKQAELDKFIKYLKTKIIHNYEVPLTMKELIADYQISPYFKDIYKYVTKDICTFTGNAGKSFKAMCENYIVVNGILFRIKYATKTSDPELILCIPETLVPSVLYQYHDHLLAGHQGVTRMYLTLKEKYYFPNMFSLIRKYILCCNVCESRRAKEIDLKANYSRIPLDFRPMSRMSVDVKYMPPSKLGYNHILMCTCEFSNWVVGIPIQDAVTETIIEALYFKIVLTFGSPKCMIMDEAKSLSSETMVQIYKGLNIQPYVVSPFNHGSNRTERYIRSVSDLICKQLEGTGDRWPLFVYPCCFAMNTYVSTATGYSPYKLVFLHDPPDINQYKFNPDQTGISLKTKQYLQLMLERQKEMVDLVVKRRTLDQQAQQIREGRKHPEKRDFAVGDLIYLSHEQGAGLHTSSRKFKKEWIGPLRIQGIQDETHYLISDWQGLVLPVLAHRNRIKHYNLNLGTIEDGELVTVSNAKELMEKLDNYDKPP